jgi:hypothetical protein
MWVLVNHLVLAGGKVVGRGTFEMKVSSFRQFLISSHCGFLAGGVTDGVLWLLGA